jgi:sulfur-carrier protein adenylyltransferase/sulfurtransferase
VNDLLVSETAATPKGVRSFQKAKDLLRKSLTLRLEALGLPDQKAYRNEAFARNIGILTSEEHERLANARVAIAGLGGVGGVYLITLARLSVGKFHVTDFDSFEPANINRQYGARIPDFGRPKLDVMIEEALRINPFLDIKAFPEGFSSANMDAFLDGVDIVLDGLDFFNFEARRLLFNRSREKGIFVITAAPLGFSSAVLIFSPEKGAMTFDEYFDVQDRMPPEDKLISFALGLAPRGTHLKYLDMSSIDLKDRSGPSVIIACQLCSAVASMEALRVLLGRGCIKPVPHYLQFDPYARKYRKGRLLLGNRNPIQKAKKLYVKKFLLKKDNVFKVTAPEIPKVITTNSPVSREAIRYILQAGIQAPSVDNAQPWKFSAADNRISLYLDPLADSSFFNFQQIASTISCGAVLENMRLAASVFGLEGDVTCFPEPDNPDCVARLNLRSTGIRKDSLHDVIWTRCTNRKLYGRKDIPSTLTADLQSQISSRNGIRLHLLTEKSDLDRLAQIIYRVDSIRTEHRQLHEHLQRMIHFKDEDALAKRAGFPIGNLEAGKAGEIFLRFTRPWPVMNCANGIGLGRLVAHRSRQAVCASSAALLMTVPGFGKKEFLSGGEAMERVWLFLTQKSISVQPMAAITLFLLRWQIEGGSGFSGKHQKLLHAVWNDYRELFRSIDFEKEGHLMLFRLGYSPTILYRTLRKNVNSFLI